MTMEPFELQPRKGKAPGPSDLETETSSHVHAPGVLRNMAGVFSENKLAVISVAFLVFIVLFCFFGPMLYNTNQTDAQDALLNSTQNAPPSANHWLGTDENGFVAALVATTVGVIYGALSGFFRGWTDSFLMRIVDIGLSIPVLFLLICLVVIYRPTTPVLILVIGAVSWLIPARLIRAETLSLRTREYVEAVRVMGGTRRRIVGRHIIPNSVGTIVVFATFDVADSILLLASLGFLGFGVAAPQTDWGTMLSNGVNYASNGYWWEIYPVGLCSVCVVVA